MSRRCANNQHGLTQHYTDTCVDCGHNIYETDAEYEASLDRELARRIDPAKERIRAKEAQLDEAIRNEQGPQEEFPTYAYGDQNF